MIEIKIIKFSIIFLTLIIVVGCSSKTNEIESLKSINIDLNRVIEEHESKESSLLEKNEILEKDIDDLRVQVKDKEDEILKINEELFKLKNIKDTNLSSFDIDELQQGDIINGLIIKNIENNERSFHIELDGYFILDGYFMLTEMGSTYIHFYGNSNGVYNPFNFSIKVGENYTQRLSRALGILNDDELKIEMGEDLYNRFSYEGSKGVFIKVPAVAVFSNYKFAQYKESEYTGTAKLI